MAADNGFLDAWDVNGPINAVFAAISHSRTYPVWCKPVYREVQTDGPPAVGRVSNSLFKGRLAYTLRIRSEIIRLAPPNVVETKAVGDLTGRGVWTLTTTHRGVHVCFDWRVSADKPLLRILTPVFGPLFRWNHKWRILRARQGLDRYVANSSSNVI